MQFESLIKFLELSQLYEKNSDYITIYNDDRKL